MAKRNQTITYIRVITSIFVVAFHSYQPFFYDFGIDNNLPQIGVYKFLFLLMQLFRMPVFFFLSGFVFYYQNSKNNAKFATTMMKKNKRLLLPYLFWSTLGVVVLLPQEISDSINFYLPVQHLWFIQALWGCFIILLALKERVEWPYVLAVALLISITYSYWPRFMCLNAIVRYFVFFALGFYYFKLREVISLKPKYFIILGIILISVYLYTNYYYDFSQVSTWKKGVVAINRVSNALSSFILIVLAYEFFDKSLHMDGDREKPSKLIAFYDIHSYGVYIVHYFIFLNLFKFKEIQSFYKANIVLAPVLMFAFLILSSSCITYMLRKTPYLKRFV